MQSIRKRLLNGETIPECDTCNNNLANVNAYRDHFAVSMFADKLDSIIENTDENGFTTLLPISYDYRVSNFCNFKCRMCSEQASSSWEVEKKMHNLITKREEWIISPSRKAVTEFQSTVVVEELWNAAKSRRIEELYWAGGEPTMLDIHWDVMKYLVDTGLSKNVEVRYNTNLSRISYKGSNLITMLRNFKKVTIQASMDGTSDIAEYIRTGLEWESWLENLKAALELRTVFGQDSVVIDVTLTMPGLFAMKDLMKLSVDLGVKSYVKLCFSANAYAILSPMVLPRALLNEMLDDLLAYEASLNSSLTAMYKDTFLSMKYSEKTFEERFPSQKEYTLNGKRYHKKIEEIRPNAKTSISKILASNPKNTRLVG